MRNLVHVFRRVLSGLRFRLVLLVALTCAPLMVLMLHTAGDDRRRAMRNWRQRSERLATTAKHEEQEVIGSARQLLLAVSESSSVRSLNARACKKSLDELFTSYPRYSNLGVLTTNGELLASAMPLAASDDRPGRAFYHRAMETRGFTIGNFRADRASTGPTVSFGYPVLDNNGEILAIVFAELDLNWLDRFGTQLPNQLPRAANWTELNRNGTILARFPNPEDWVGRRLPERSLLPALFNEPDGVLEATDAGGTGNFYAFSSFPSRLASGDVVTLLAIPREILFADADRLLERNLTWLGLAAGLTFVLAWVGAKFLVLRPVKRLVALTARLASGDLSARTGLAHSHDELGQLTLSFDQMAQALEERELERQRASHKLQALSHRLVEVQETERRHIARELHDEIGQSLTAAELNLQAALRSPGSVSVERRLEDSIQAVERVLEQVHDLSLNLRPSMLDDLGLEPALRWYTHRQAALTGMQAVFRADPIEGRLDLVIETECFRVAQEALTNVVRHAQAKAVTVELTRRNGHLHLSVRDNGVGFDVPAQRDEAVRGASLGLLSMEERASLAGGGLEFNSAPGEGTEVHAWFPLQIQNANLCSPFNE